jgi:hypothetical protein
MSGVMTGSGCPGYFSSHSTEYRDWVFARGASIEGATACNISPEKAAAVQWPGEQPSNFGRKEGNLYPPYTHLHTKHNRLMAKIVPQLCTDVELIFTSFGILQACQPISGASVG